MSDNLQERIAHYNDLVRQYEQLENEIKLFLGTDGKTDELRADKLQKYRELANRRDDLFSEIRAIEQELFLDE